MIRSLVVRLLNVCRPAAIAGLIVSVVVDPVDASIIGARSHICVEGEEIVTPFVAHCDSASSIVRVGPVILIEASFLNLLPGEVFATFVHPVFCVPSALSNQATATFSLTVNESVFVNVALFSTRAFTDKVDVVSCHRFGFSQHSQTFKCVSWQNRMMFVSHNCHHNTESAS